MCKIMPPGKEVEVRNLREIIRLSEQIEILVEIYRALEGGKRREVFIQSNLAANATRLKLITAQGPNPAERRQETS